MLLNVFQMVQIGEGRTGHTSYESSSKKDKASHWVGRRAHLKMKSKLCGTLSFNTLQYPNFVGKWKIVRYRKESTSTNSLSYFILTLFLNVWSN